MIGLICVCLMHLFVGVLPVFAADVSSVGIATYLPVQGKVENGDIISATTKGYILSQQSYDAQMAGVVASKPAIALKTDTEGNENSVPVVSVGQVSIKVTGTNGNIKKGDYITSSGKPGTGMKSTRSGYVIGQALEEVKFDKKEDVKLVSVNLNLHFLQVGSPVSNSLLNIFAISQIAAYEQPLSVFKYLISAFILLLSFIFGFFVFTRAVNSGIQALGRNPLAGRMIQLSIIFNVVLVIIVITSAIGVIWIFLRI